MSAINRDLAAAVAAKNIPLTADMALATVKRESKPPWRVRFLGPGFRLSAEHATEEQAYAAAREAAACAGAGKPVTFTQRGGNAERSCMGVRGISVLRYDKASDEWWPHSRNWSARTPRSDALTPLSVDSTGGGSR